jgi:hypothetical protein
MPRYVILEHDWPERHWDFMLEAGTVLQTWRLRSVPRSGMDIQAEKSFDHRLQYLDYEGPISGGRGKVIQWDAGSFELIEEKYNRRCLRLHGRRLSGTVEIREHVEGAWNWRLSGEECDADGH